MGKTNISQESKMTRYNISVLCAFAYMIFFMISLTHPLDGYLQNLNNPGESFHAWRFLGVPVVDTGGAIAVSVLIAWYWKLNAFTVTFVVAVLVSIPVHLMFNVKSVLVKLLF
jgi:hypothetical protein